MQVQLWSKMSHKPSISRRYAEPEIDCDMLAISNNINKKHKSVQNQSSQSSFKLT